MLLKNKSKGASGTLLLVAAPLLAMVLVVIGIWIHAARELQPPVYDALSYVLKARNFWQAFLEYGLFNANAIEPVVRPFATVLVSYPFGYSADFRWFYFRTNAIPSLILGLSVFIAAGSWRSLSVSARKRVVALSIIALSIPSIFQFAATDDLDYMGNWGFFDLAVGSFSALGVAFAVRHDIAIIARAVWVSLLAVLIIYTKPAGLSVMVMLAGIWLIMAGLQWREGQASLRQLTGGIAVFLVVYGVAAATLVGSAYFSVENYRYGVRSMQLLNELGMPGLATLIRKLHISAGLPLIALTFLGVVIAWQRRAWAVAVLTLLVIVSGTWIWLGRTNAEHVRYFIPFPLMAYTLVVPILVKISPGKLQGWLFNGFAGVGLLQFLMTLSLLFQSSPSQTMQRMVGINLTAGRFADEIAGGERLAQRLAQRPSRDAIIYYATFTADLLAFQSVLEYRRNLDMLGGNSIPSLPVDWVRDHAYRLAEITRADYVVFPSNKREWGKSDTSMFIEDFHGEEIATTAWLSGLGADEGVSIIDSGSIRTLEVIDRDRFIAAARHYANTQKQRPVALENFEIKAPASLSLLPAPITMVLGGTVVTTLTSATLVEGDHGGRSLRIVMESSNNPPHGNWLLFAHQIYADGSYGDAYAQVDWMAGNSAPHVLVLPVADSAKMVVAYGIGVMEPQAAAQPLRFLMSDMGEWGGMRNMLACPQPGCALNAEARN